ncbi:MAG: hypothetical protein ACRYE9_02635 [Janthinobacterium lividum]
MIDDFCVSAPALWNSVGKFLISELKTFTESRKISQILIVSGAHDIDKKQLLKDNDLSLASEWFVSKVTKT